MNSMQKKINCDLAFVRPHILSFMGNDNNKRKGIIEGSSFLHVNLGDQKNNHN